jgi:lysophospholipase
MRTKTVRDPSNSLDLRYATSENAAQANRFLVFVNGRSEWIEKYSTLPTDLKIGSDTGFMTFDHRGQGASGGARAWIDEYDTYAYDMKTVVDAAIGSKPYNLVCHSMGGLIALQAIMRGLIKPRCLVLSSPLIGMPNKPMPAPLAYYASSTLTGCLLGHLHTGIGRYWRPPFEKNVLTHSADRYEIIQNSPYPVPSPTFEWVKASYLATQFVMQPENLAKLDMPVLVLCGTEERVVDPEALPRWVTAANQHSRAGVDFHWIQGGYHELLIESKPIAEPVMTLIRSWFDQKGFPL